MLNELHNVVKLIDLVKNRPGIYDYSLGEHNNRAIVENLWKEVADEMGASSADCRRKWASLRNALSRDIRNEKEETINQRKKKKWYLSEHLSFLRNYLNYKIRVPKDDPRADESFQDELNCSMDENKSFFDFSTQDVINECLPSEETKVLMDSKRSFESVNAISIIETTQLEAQPPPLPPPLPLPPLPPLPPPVPVPATIPAYETEQHYITETPCAKRRRPDESLMFDDQNMTFFKSIIPDVLRLSERQQRLYKQNVLMRLYKLLDEQETT